MLPLVIIVGYLLALAIRARSTRAVREYTVNLMALVLVSFMIFIPLLHYSQENPGEFWNRTAGRLFGEAYTVDPDTQKITIIPNEERIANFEKNLPVLADNMAKSLLMFNWRGDTSWFNGSPEAIPAMDFFAGAMLACGLCLTVGRAIRRREPVDALLPFAIV